ncbi:cysteine proteinase inhibitor A-like [Impatiens glandulifera]|uniref:cysteine proteinase inhibitor A-like n=1 Tax=Impatiens glandulifera TaxID=253017 RepID=UPI001FB06B63|nr:cysteine proteinase inhibitor A-like [Impatiens glandulifera]
MAKVGGIHEKDGASNNSNEIDNLVRFAIDDHNKKSNAQLELVKVLNVKQQVVAGTVYYITLEVKDGGQKKEYETKVWVKPWMDFKQVQEFKLVGDASSSFPTV